jgi:hypothetical protein
VSQLCGNVLRSPVLDFGWVAEFMLILSVDTQVLSSSCSACCHRLRSDIRVAKATAHAAKSMAAACLQTFAKAEEEKRRKEAQRAAEEQRRKEIENVAQEKRAAALEAQRQEEARARAAIEAEKAKLAAERKRQEELKRKV